MGPKESRYKKGQRCTETKEHLQPGDQGRGDKWKQKTKGAHEVKSQEQWKFTERPQLALELLTLSHLIKTKTKTRAVWLLTSIYSKFSTENIMINWEPKEKFTWKFHQI